MIPLLKLKPELFDFMLCRLGVYMRWWNARPEDFLRVSKAHKVAIERWLACGDDLIGLRKAGLDFKCFLALPDDCLQTVTLFSKAIPALVKVGGKLDEVVARIQRAAQHLSGDETVTLRNLLRKFPSSGLLNLNRRHLREVLKRSRSCILTYLIKTDQDRARYKQQLQSIMADVMNEIPDAKKQRVNCAR